MINKIKMIRAFFFENEIVDLCYVNFRPKKKGDDSVLFVKEIVKKYIFFN